MKLLVPYLSSRKSLIKNQHQTCQAKLSLLVDFQMNIQGLVSALFSGKYMLGMLASYLMEKTAHNRPNVDHINAFEWV